MGRDVAEVMEDSFRGIFKRKVYGSDRQSGRDPLAVED